VVSGEGRRGEMRDSGEGDLGANLAGGDIYSVECAAGVEAIESVATYDGRRVRWLFFQPSFI